MRFRRNAQLDSSQVSDRRGMGGMAVGGGGLIALVVVLLNMFGGGGGADLSGLQLGEGDQGATSNLSETCTTGEDANQRDDCRIVGVINSVQSYWQSELDGYRPTKTVFFTGGTNTGCGSATSAVGPFYCPLDSQVYIDLGFYEELRNRFGANGGPFAEAYVIAHEYGHHIENLLGVLERAGGNRETGPQSTAVRVELMADCLAGMWANGAVATGYIEELNDADIRDGLDAASAIGDDRIQEQMQGQVQPESWTHGSAEQRQKWFLTGYRTGNMDDCDTFAAPRV